VVFAHGLSLGGEYHWMQPDNASNFVFIDPTKRSGTWVLQRADIDCKAEVSSEKWFDHLRLRHRVDPIYVSCMQHVRPEVTVLEAAPSTTTAGSAKPISLRPADWTMTLVIIVA